MRERGDVHRDHPTKRDNVWPERPSAVKLRNGERISQQAMETPFLAAPGFIKADVVDGTQGRIFSHIGSSQCWRVGTT